VTTWYPLTVVRFRSRARRVAPGLAVLAWAWCAVAAAGHPKLPSGEPAPPQGPNPFLAQAKELYQKLDFEKCLARLAQAPQWRSSPKELLEIELYGGMCAYNLNQLPQAEEHFRLALRIAPTAELPPYTSPKLVDFFRRIQRSMPRPPREKPDQGEQQKAEKERAEREEAERQKAEQARAERERAEQQRAEQQRAEREQAEQQKAEKERAERERAEPQNAPKAEAKAQGSRDAEPRDDGQPVEAVSDVPRRETARAEAPLPTPEPPAPAAGQGLPPPGPSFVRRHAGPLATGGAAVVALAVGIGLGANAKGLEARANQAQYDSDFHALGSAAQANATGANVACGVAAVAAVAAVVWLLLDPG
jgi:hypothetical protein